MSLWTNLSGGLRALLHKRESEAEMDDELRAYLDAATEQKTRSGMSAADAGRAARVEMGSMEAVKDEIRIAGWETAVEALWSDIRYAVRVLSGTPIFTGVVMITLALGIGANTAIFSLIDSLLLRSLPIQHPEELVEVSHTTFTNPLWEQVRDRQDVFSGVFAWSPDRFNLSRAGMARLRTVSGSAGISFGRWASTRRPAGCFRPRMTSPGARPERCSATAFGRATTAAARAPSVAPFRWRATRSKSWE